MHSRLRKYSLEKGKEEGDFGLIIRKTTTIQFGRSKKKKIRERSRNIVTNCVRTYESVRGCRFSFTCCGKSLEGSVSRAENLAQ